MMTQLTGHDAVAERFDGAVEVAMGVTTTALNPPVPTALIAQTLIV